MRTRVAVVAVVAVAIAAATHPPSAQADTSLNVRVRTTGVIAVVWHGDPARGCAAAGMCEVDGSVTYRPPGDIDLELGSDGSAGFGLGEMEPAVVRVRGTTPGSATAGCVDLLPMDLDTHIGDITEGQVTFGFAALGLSSGRCAGPRPADLDLALPRDAVAARDLARRGRTLDLSGRAPFVAGPFSGTVISTVEVRVSRARRTSAADAGRRFEGIGIELGGGPPRRLAGLLLTYRLQPLGGSIVSEFAGLHSPACQVLDACGARGRSTLELKSDAGEMQLLAVRTRGKRLPSVGSMLRAVRSGKLGLEGFAYFPRMTARVSSSVTFANGQTCTDSVFADAPEPQVRRGRDRLAIVLTSAGDSVRTHCPGPSEDDATHTEVLARASFALSDVGRRVLPLGLGTPRTFSARGFSGTRRGTVPLELRLLGAEVITGRQQ